jgi:hypothetical protein
MRQTFNLQQTYKRNIELQNLRKMPALRLARVIGCWSRPGSQNIHNSFFTLLRAVAFWRCLEFRKNVTQKVIKK